MPSYIILANFTEQGIRNVKQSPARQREFDEMAQRYGVKVREIYLTMGGYDFVAILEAPDDETTTRLLLSLCSRGNVHTQTLKAFTRAEFEKLVESLP